MIANARMYSVSPEAAALWRELLAKIVAVSGLPIELLDYPAPAPMAELWARSDKGAVFMCGLPVSMCEPAPLVIAAPVPLPPRFDGDAHYWSDFVVRTDSEYHSVESTFGRRMAFTEFDSQSGWAGPLSFLMEVPGPRPLFAELVGPTVTPLGALSAVLEDAADVAPIDSYALRLLSKYRADLTSRVRIVGSTRPTPIPPVVASHGVAAARDIETLRDAFTAAHRTAATATLMARLSLERFVRTPTEFYVALRESFHITRDYWDHHELATTMTSFNSYIGPDALGVT